MNKQVVITVAGRNGSGKTTISMIIEKALKDAGLHNVSLFDQDGHLPLGDTLEDVAERTDRIQALAERQPSIDIVQQQLRRID